MRTRKATEAERSAYRAMQENSENWKVVEEGAAIFYANGADWTGLEKELEVWNAARKRWDAEVTAAGFYPSCTGIRKIK